MEVLSFSNVKMRKKNDELLSVFAGKLAYRLKNEGAKVNVFLLFLDLSATI